MGLSHLNRFDAEILILLSPSVRLKRQPDLGCRGAHGGAFLVRHLVLDLDQVTALIVDPLGHDLGGLDRDVVRQRRAAVIAG